MSDLYDALSTYLKDNASALRVFAFFGRYTNNVGETVVETVARAMRLPPREVRAVFKALEGMKIGRLILGRHGESTRFEWSKPVTEVVKVAFERAPADKLDDPSWLLDAAPSGVLPDAPVAKRGVREFTVPLRGKLSATLTLPVGFTKADVAKVRRFLEFFKE